VSGGHRIACGIAGWTLLLVAGLGLAGCTAAYDNDGDLVLTGTLAAPAPKNPDAAEIVVDTDLGPDDLVALAYLLRRPDVRVLAVTVPRTGLVSCPAGVDLAHDLIRAVRATPVPISCGTAPRGPHGIPFPQSWSVNALSHSGLSRDLVSWTHPIPTPASELLGLLAKQHPGLQVVALGPLTDLAALRAADPKAYARVHRIVAMAGLVNGPPQDQTAGEWNAAADPDALAAVLRGPVPATLVPQEVVPDGPPAGMRAPVVGAIGVLTPAPPPRFWDLATAGYFTDPNAGVTRTGTWSVSVTHEPGRLSRVGGGADNVVTELDTAELDRAYRSAFAAGG
jgi:inosine-uridine nucleoside N-ribohydrolase